MGHCGRDPEGSGAGCGRCCHRRALSAGQRQDHHHRCGARAPASRSGPAKISPTGGGGPICQPRLGRWAGAFLLISTTRNYLEGALTATEIWSPITSYYDNLAAPNSGLMYANTPWSGHYEVQGTIWATAHTTQFAQPGWQYLDSASGYLPENGSYVALRSPDKKDWSVVLETIDAHAPQTVAFHLAGGLAAKDIHVWETNNSRTFEHVADLKPADGSFEYSFDPDSLYSLTTTTGQGKGSAQPPPSEAFPFPYADDFEKTSPGRAPKYLSDQDGAFEVHAMRWPAGPMPGASDYREADSMGSACRIRLPLRAARRGRITAFPPMCTLFQSPLRW